MSSTHMHPDPEHTSPDQLLHQDEYTPEELDQLLGLGEYVIRRAAREGELRALVVNDDVVSIRREDALDWLARRDRDARHAIGDEHERGIHDEN